MRVYRMLFLLRIRRLRAALFECDVQVMMDLSVRKNRRHAGLLSRVTTLLAHLFSRRFILALVDEL